MSLARSGSRATQRANRVAPRLLCIVAAVSCGLAVDLAIVASHRHEQAVDEPVAVGAVRLQDEAEYAAVSANVMIVIGVIATALGVALHVGARRDPSP